MEQKNRAFYIGYATALLVVTLIWLAHEWATATKEPQIEPAKARIQAVKIERETEGA